MTQENRKTGIHTTSMYNRIMRVVVPIIMGTFLIIGLVLLFGIRTTSTQSLTQSHHTEIESIVGQVNDELQRPIQDLGTLAGERDVQDFARNTLLSNAGAALDDAQTRLLGDFTNLLQQHPNYLAVRYVTFNGSIWSEATNYDASIPKADSSVRLGKQANDPTLALALSAPPGQVVSSDVSFVLNPNAPILDRLVPYIRFAAPIVSDASLGSNVAGVIELDIQAQPVLDFLSGEAKSLAGREDGRRVLIANSAGQLFYDTAHPNEDYVRELALNTALKLSDQYPGSAILQPKAPAVDGQADNGSFFSTGHVVFSGNSGAYWSIVLVDNEAALEGSANAASFGALIASLLVGALISLLIGVILRRTTRPIRSVNALVTQWSSGDSGQTTVPVPPTATDDEVGQLMTAFQSMSTRVEGLKGELEAQQGRYTRNMDITARVSRETATLHDIDDLLNRSINLICDEFGFYHAQVFLTDDVSENAVLVYSHGAVGEQLIEAGHKIPVGSSSVIGTVTRIGEPVIINDTQDTGDSPHMVNPLLPHTRAEIALPLQVGDQIIGALDVQSTEAHSFQPDDVRTFQILADQIAIAIQNARLLVQSEQRVTQIDALNRQLTRMAWEETSQRSGLETIYHYDLLKLDQEQPTEPPSLTLPISIRGEVVGTIDAAPPEGTNFTEGDQVIMRAVADRVAIAIENARLFEETQSSLAETFTLYQLSRYLNEADSLEDILQAIIVSVMPEASSGQIGVFSEYGANGLPDNFEITVDWSINERAPEGKLTGQVLRFSDHALLTEMQPNQVTLITNAARDHRLDDTFRRIVGSTGAQSMVFIPFSVRGIWRGVIMVEFPAARDFTEREGRIYGALIDQAGIAIDNRMLLHQNEMALAEIERLYAASRIINMAQSMPDLVRAAVNITNDPKLNFELSIFEGQLDPTGWPMHARMIARSHDGEVYNADELLPFSFGEDSPLRRREPMVLRDLNPRTPSDDEMINYMRTHGLRMVVTLPLFSANQPIALFHVISSELRELSGEDYDVFRALTGQMSTVLQNRRLLEQTELALDETRRLYAASRSIVAAADSAAVYQAAAIHLATATTSVNRVSILMAQPTPEANAPYVEYAHVWTRTSTAASDLDQGDRVARDLVPFADILQPTDGTLLLRSVKGDLVHWPALQTLLERSGSSSAAITEIHSRQRWYGVIICESPQAAAFNESYVNFLRAVADQVAIAVESLTAFAEAQAQAQRALALAEAGQLASRMSTDFALSLDEVFQRIAGPANFDRWLLALLNESKTGLDAIIDHSPAEFQSLQTRQSYFDIATNRTPIMQTFKSGQRLILNDPTSFPNYDKLTAKQQEAIGKTMITPVRLSGDVVGVLLVGRTRRAADLNESDEQLINTLAAQVAIAVENQRLLRAAEGERERLSSILESLPAGVLVLDPVTYKPIQFNKQIETLLGRPVEGQQPFDAATYNIYRSGTDALYPDESLPIFAVKEAKSLIASDDVAVLMDDGTEIDLLLNAVPILTENGEVRAIVAAFQDISALRNLERTLETNLRETVALYETTRALAEAEQVDDVLDQVLAQLATQDVSDAYVALLDNEWQGVRIARSLSGTAGEWTLPGELLNNRSALYIADVETSFDLDDVTRLALHNQNIGALASLPLRARSRREVPLGWLVIVYEQAQEFGAEREQFLSTLTDSAAIALDNRNLLQSTEQALQETAALYGVTTNLSRARTADEIAEAVQGAFEILTPDIYAAYLTVEDRLTQLFNVSLDAAPTDFAGMINQHRLLDAQNIFIDDLRALTDPSPFERDLMTQGNIRALALVHLRSQTLPIGCLIVAYHTTHPFGAGDARYLSSIADSASVVVDNYLLLDQIQNSLEETSILYQASRALNDASTPADILDVIVSHLSSRPITQVFIALLSTENWDHPKAMAQVVATWQREGDAGIDLNGINLVAEQYPAWRLLASPEVMTIDDVSESEDLDMMEKIGVESLELRSLSILPLRIAGRSIGAVVLGGRDPYHHTERDQRIYRSLAEQASLRLEAARLLAQTERRARQLTTSAEVSQIASSILDLNDLLPRMVDLIRESFEYDHVQIFLLDEDDAYAVLRASTGEAGRQLLDIQHRLQKGSQSVIGQVTATGQPTIASDTADARVVHRPNPYLPNTRSEMAIPLKLKGQVVVGALDVQSNEPNAFDDDDIQVLTTLAAQISVAIDNARLFEQSRQRANEMSFLFDVTTAAAAADTLQVAIQNVAIELRESLNGLSVSIYLPQVYIDADEEEIIILKPVALAGSDQPLSELSEVRIDADDNLIAEAARTRRSITIDNINVSEYLPVVDDARSAIIVPLVAGAQLIGLIALESTEFAAYGDDTLRLLLTLSGTLSAIIQNQQLLETVQQTNEQLRELDRLKSDFLANMSHELRTPLNSIIGFSRVILKGIDGPLTEMQEQDLSTIYNSGQHLLNLINDILDQAKIAAGKMDLQLDYFEMKNVIDGVRSIGIGLVKDKQIDIFVDIAPGLPKVFGDEFRTRQVLINLISNAAKFTKEGSITISTYPVRDEETGFQMIRTDVTDTGIGIAEKDMGLLFEAFRQVDSSLTRTQGGTGLGLPISKSLVEMQGGRMIVSSRVNVGSTFSVLMPIEPVVPQEDKEKPKKKKTDQLPQTGGLKSAVTGPLPPIPSEMAQTMETPPYLHTKRQILLIEDNPDMVDQYRRALQREGFDIFTASIPLEAEAMASGLHPTIIIMDVNFGEGQGWNILGKLKARDDTFDIPVIVVTLSNERERADNMSAFKFIQRPFMPDELVSAVQEAERESRISRILIIDDQPESVRLLTQLLEEQGEYRVFSAPNGAEGIALVARRRPNLVVLDLRMPEMDGFQVIQELRNNPETATIPILIVTGDTLNTDERGQLSNLAVLQKTEISAEEYRQFIDGVRTYLNGD
ncbi:MAG TPA: GAF domain-containing protein [Phototrophicaceae bacterium]|nr:GAF domain-containing protein [Phototrophicaceae bacterium]